MNNEGEMNGDFMYLLYSGNFNFFSIFFNFSIPFIIGLFMLSVIDLTSNEWITNWFVKLELIYLIRVWEINNKFKYLLWMKKLQSVCYFGKIIQAKGVI